MQMSEKQCNKCGTVKSLDQFAKNKNCADGHLTTCRDCAKIYRQQNADRRRTIDTDRRRRHGVKPKVVFASDEERKAAHSQACIRWQQRNYRQFSEQQKIYRDLHKERRYALIKEWRQENAGRVNALSAKRRAAVYKATPSWVNHEAIAAIYEQSQELSNITGIEHHVDHYYPINGKTVCGLHVAENLQVITKQENLDKGNKHPDEFYRGV